MNRNRDARTSASAGRGALAGKERSKCQAAAAEPVRVLLVEDDVESGVAMQSSLAGRGVDVVFVPGFAEAVEKLSQQEFDAVVADVMLDGLNGEPSGLKLIAEARRVDPDLSVVLITGYASDHSGEQAAETGAGGYLRKPLDSIDELLSPVLAAADCRKRLRHSRHMEEMAKESQARLEGILSSIDDLVFLFDAETRFVLNYAPPQRRLQSSPSVFIGKRHAEIMPPEVDRKFRPAFEAAKRGKVSEYEYECPGSEGTEYWQAKLSPIVTDGVFTGAVAVVRNTTQRREKELIIRELAAQVELAEERERHKMAEDLHDHVVQDMVGIAMLIEGVLDHRTVHGDSRVHLAMALSALHQSVTNARTLMTELGSPLMHDLKFESALKAYVAHAREMYSIAATYKDDGKTKPLSRDVACLLFRSVRELFHNCAKHSDAKHAKLVVSRVEDKSIRIVFENDGEGFDPAEKLASMPVMNGFGLWNIKQRITLLGGAFEVESRPDRRGVKVSWVAPLLGGAAEGA